MNLIIKSIIFTLIVGITIILIIAQTRPLQIEDLLIFYAPFSWFWTWRLIFPKWQSFWGNLPITFEIPGIRKMISYITLYYTIPLVFTLIFGILGIGIYSFIKHISRISR